MKFFGSTELTDFSTDLGFYKPADLIAAVKLARQFVFDLETTGLSPKKDRIEGVAFYVPAVGDLKKPVRAWYPFNPFTFMCHLPVSTVQAKWELWKQIGVDLDQLAETIKGKEPHEIVLCDLRPPMDQEETMTGLRPVWEEIHDAISIAANRKFDDGFLYYASGTTEPIVVRGIIGDSMLADFCSDERRTKYGLKTRVKQVFGHDMTTYADAVRGAALLSFCDAKPLGVYAMDDCEWTWRLHEHALAQLRKQSPVKKDAKPIWTIEKALGRPMGKLERIYWGIDCKISSIIMEMENAGVLIDWRWLVQVEERLAKEKAEIAARIEKYLGWPLNPNSSKQVADALFAPPPDGLGLPMAGIPIGKTGDPSTSDKVIKHFARFHPLVADILKWRSLDTVETGFVKKLIKLATESSDGRIYGHFNQTRTVIARLSSSDPINFQNQPRDKNLVRKAYCAYREGIDEPDMLLLGGDYGQIELRIAAHLANEANMIEVYQMGGICTAESGGPCLRYTFYECRACDACAPPNTSVPGKLLCSKCGSEDIVHQARCRHVDLHQRTAEDVQVKRNPLAKNCVTGDSMVLTEHGLMRIDEIVTGPDRQPNTTKIVCDDGKLRPLDSTYAGGEQDILSVEMEYGLKVKATPDHEFFVMEAGQIVRRRADELKPGDAAIIMTGRNVHGTSVDLPDVKVEANTSFKDVDLPRRLTPEIARFFGYLVAEGKIETYPERNYYQVQFGFSESSVDMVDDFLHCANALVGGRFNTWRDPDRRAVYYTITSKKLNAWLDLMGFGHDSGDKNIPRCVRAAPWELKREFLRAYFEGDGTNKRPSSITGKGSYVVACCSKSELLIRQLHAELANVDILGYIHSEWRKTDKGEQQYWIWSIRRQRDLARFRDLIGFISKDKQEALDRALTVKVTDRANRYLDNVEPLLETIYDKVKRKQKDKLREVIRRSADSSPVRLGDTRIELLADVLPPQIQSYIQSGVWTAKIQKVEPAGRAQVYDLYEPERTAMVVNSCVILDCNFGLLYRMGAPKFCVYADLFDADGMPMVDFAKDIIARWHGAYPNIAPFHEITEYYLERNNWIAETIFGRRRRLDQEMRINRFRAVTQGIQFKVSGSAQDIMKAGMIRVVEERNKRIANARPAERALWKKFRILLQIHDELVCEVPAAIKAEASVLMKTAMESIAKGHLRVPLVFDVKTGRTWDDIH